MGCTHDRLMTVGNRVYCVNCKAELPLEFLIGNKPAETVADAPEDKAPGKSTGRKRTAKKAFKGE